MQFSANGNVSALLFYCTVLFNSDFILADAPSSDKSPKGPAIVEKKPRIEPIAPANWTDEVHEALGAFPSSRDFVVNKWKEGSDDLRGRNTLGFLAHYPELAKAFLTLNKHVAADTSLTFRDKEIIILRTARRRGADNEFAQHIILGRRAGLTDDELMQFINGADADQWPEPDASLVRATDELFEHSRIRESTMDALANTFSDKQLMDIVFLAGSYSLLSSAINSFNIPLDGGMEKSDPLIPLFMKALEDTQ